MLPTSLEIAGGFNEIGMCKLPGIYQCSNVKAIKDTILKVHSLDEEFKRCPR